MREVSLPAVEGLKETARRSVLRSIPKREAVHEIRLGEAGGSALDGLGPRLRAPNGKEVPRPPGSPPANRSLARRRTDGGAGPPGRNADADSGARLAVD